ncbi:MAG: TIM barrel protein [Clostridia bacterium]|nr:TIM barrel protein [Clostridia bacterium]
MIRFGPAGNCDSFYAEGHKASVEAPAWLNGRGLTAYEYSFGHGISLREDTARQIAGEARENGVRVSVHAPYYINLANPDPEKRAASFRYILESARRAVWLGGDRVVVHVGAQQKLTRDEALRHCEKALREVYPMLEAEGLGEAHICPETMGRPSQIGDLKETLRFCLLDERLIPCIDFAHLHALGQGALNGPEAFAAVLDEIESALGIARARRIHIHFSTIEYGPKGEVRHRTFAEPDFGPRFEHLAPLLAARGYEPTVICECRGTQAEDARAMKDIYEGVIQ